MSIHFHDSSFQHRVVVWKENIDYLVNKKMYFYYLGIAVLNFLPSQSDKKKKVTGLRWPHAVKS